MRKFRAQRKLFTVENAKSHTNTHTHAHKNTFIYTRQVKSKCHLMSAKVMGYEWNPEGDLSWSESEVTGPSGYDLSIPCFHPSHPPGCPLHGRLHWPLSKRGTWRRTLPWEVRDPQVTRWIPLETLQRTSSVQTRPVFNWHSAVQSGAVKPETVGKHTVKFQMKPKLSIRLNQRGFEYDDAPVLSEHCPQ